MLKALIFGLLVISTFAFSKDSEKKGYWWYEEAPKVATKKEREPLPELPAREKMLDMHPDDLNKMQEEYQKQAVWRPTPKHVRDYYVIQDTIRRKAQAYMAVSGLVMLNNPELNVAKEYPTTSPGRATATKQRERALGKSLEQFRQSYALVFFTDRSCQYCVVQRQALKRFQERHGWSIRELDIKQYPEAAERFDASFTPMTLLVKKDSEKWMPVAVGVESVPVIEENIYRGLRLMRGDIAPEQYYTMEYEQGGAFDPMATFEGSR